MKWFAESALGRSESQLRVGREVFSWGENWAFNAINRKHYFLLMSFTSKVLLTKVKSAMFIDSGRLGDFGRSTCGMPGTLGELGISGLGGYRNQQARRTRTTKHDTVNQENIREPIISQFL